ncbi:MAG: AI-2E family transporter [Enterovibrio sp.]
MFDHPKLENSHWILIAALALAAYACYGLIAPYLGSIMLAFIISLLFYPLHQMIASKMKTWPNLAAFLSCLLLTVIFVIPLIFISSAVLHQGVGTASRAYLWLTQGGAREVLAMPLVNDAIFYINRLFPAEGLDTQQIVGKAAQTVSTLSSSMLSFSSALLSDVTGVLANFLLMLFVLFFLLRDHDIFIQTLRHVSPLSRSQEDTLLNDVRQVAKSAVIGSFLTALAQGIVGGIAMGMAGFAGIFAGCLMAFASFIPVVGTAFVWLPAAGYLFLNGEWQWGLFLVVWGVVVIGSVDNLLRPLLMQGNSSMNTVLIFFSLLGGLQMYGLIGLIYGPVIFSLTLALFKLYETQFREFLDKQDRS